MCFWEGSELSVHLAAIFVSPPSVKPPFCSPCGKINQNKSQGNTQMTQNRHTVLCLKIFTFQWVAQEQKMIR